VTIEPGKAIASVIDPTYDNLDFSLAHLLADVGDCRASSKEEHLASFMKTRCSQNSKGETQTKRVGGRLQRLFGMLLEERVAC
jgi:hypothetical protein